jgi:glucose-6-phosphate 1-dehydrogenase
MLSLSNADWNQLQALGMLGHLAGLIARNRALGSSPQELAKWQIQCMSDHGYYTEQLSDAADSFEHFVQEFVRGRKLMYEKVAIAWEAEEAVVESLMWFAADLPEVLFYFEVSLEEFSAYAKALAEAHARASGMRVVVEHLHGRERAHISFNRPTTTNGIVCPS